MHTRMIHNTFKQVYATQTLTGVHEKHKIGQHRRGSLKERFGQNLKIQSLSGADGKSQEVSSPAQHFRSKIAFSKQQRA